MILQAAASIVIGLIFGLGLVISGMINPEKVLNFLDVSGRFDPSLAFVMIGAITVTFIGYRFVLRRPKPVLTDAFELPSRTSIDHRVIIGPALFGIGWGLAGFCPGPAIASAGIGSEAVWIFLAAMFSGLALARGLVALRS